jgi:hypothetical protein
MRSGHRTKRRATLTIIPCEINAVVKSLSGQPKKGEIAQIAPHGQIRLTPGSPATSAHSLK